ncbi:hypothetical protein NDU88_000719 [Pleurodeles waltl]|uniref:Uncharacterized protein n=1 Tax=Pleurodeles waltl TaxID=8319 RepID=A0AAV7LWL7_PLEWA|nr:hypothetical protein NDU88_000719 [Pleurodeles waltl]
MPGRQLGLAGSSAKAAECEELELALHLPAATENGGTPRGQALAAAGILGNSDRPCGEGAGHQWERGPFLPYLRPPPKRPDLATSIEKDDTGQHRPSYEKSRPQERSGGDGRHYCKRHVGTTGNQEHPPCGGDQDPTLQDILQAITASREILERKIDALATDLTILRDDHRRLSEKVSTTGKQVKEILPKINDTTKNMSKMEK